MGWFITQFGERLGRILFGVSIILALLLALGIVRACTHKSEAPQTEQTTASGDAVTNAAQDAISTYANRTEAERAMDAATAQVKEELPNAAVPDDLRVIIARSVCVRPEYHNDPACAVR